MTRAHVIKDRSVYIKFPKSLAKFEYSRSVENHQSSNWDIVICCIVTRKCSPEKYQSRQSAQSAERSEKVRVNHVNHQRGENEKMRNPRVSALLALWIAFSGFSADRWKRNKLWVISRTREDHIMHSRICREHIVGGWSKWMARLERRREERDGCNSLTFTRFRDIFAAHLRERRASSMYLSQIATSLLLYTASFRPLTVSSPVNHLSLSIPETWTPSGRHIVRARARITRLVHDSALSRGRYWTYKNASSTQSRKNRRAIRDKRLFVLRIFMSIIIESPWATDLLSD